MHIILGLLGVNVGELHGNLSQAQVNIQNLSLSLSERSMFRFFYMYNVYELSVYMYSLILEIGNLKEV